MQGLVSIVFDMCRIHVSPIPVSTDLLQKNAHIMCSLFVSYSHSFSLTAVLNVDKDLNSGAKDDGSEWIVWTEYYDKIDGLNDHWAKGRVMSHVQLMIRLCHILVSLTLTYTISYCILLPTQAKLLVCLVTLWVW